MTALSAESDFIKIEALAIAAQFLTDNEEELNTQAELLSVIEETARKDQEFRND